MKIDINTLSSRTVHLIEVLKDFGFHHALRALELVIDEMNAEKGYKRHDGRHYYHHLVDVCQILINLQIKGNKDENLLTAALLHDIVEDVPGYTIRKISKMFNPRVAEIVDKVTKRKGVDYKNPKNLLIYLNNILEDEDATYLKTSDRMNNFATLKFASFEKKLRQANETEKYFIPFFKEARQKYIEHSYFFFFAKSYIEPHLWEIKEHHKTFLEVQRLKKIIKDNHLLVGKKPRK
jgi:GTP pyrophosphokinase